MPASAGGGGGADGGDADAENPRFDPLVGAADSGGVDCVVCMEQVGPFPLRASTYMVTPCDHLFHAACLQPWLDHQLQCPTCRLALPQP
jgi:hypothetical protein